MVLVKPHFANFVFCLHIDDVMHPDPSFQGLRCHIPVMADRLHQQVGFSNSQKESTSWNAFCWRTNSLINRATSSVSCSLSGRASEPTSCTISMSLSSS